MFVAPVDWKETIVFVNAFFVAVAATSFTATIGLLKRANFDLLLFASTFSWWRCFFVG